MKSSNFYKGSKLYDISSYKNNSRTTKIRNKHDNSYKFLISSFLSNSTLLDNNALHILTNDDINKVINISYDQPKKILKILKWLEKRRNSNMMI